MVNLKLPKGFTNFNTIGYIIVGTKIQRACDFITGDNGLFRFIFVGDIISKIRKFKQNIVIFIMSLKSFGSFI